MRKIPFFSLMLLICSVAFSADIPLPDIPWPEKQKQLPNLLDDPAFTPRTAEQTAVKGWNNNGGKAISLKWLTAAGGEKILELSTDSPGYHYGLQQNCPLEPNSEYLYYIIARGTIGAGSKAQVLYREIRSAGERRCLSSAVLTNQKKDFDWQLFSAVFRTPPVLPKGTASLYPLLLYGTTRIQCARAGLIRLGPAFGSLPPIPDKFKNLLNNSQFAMDRNGFPLDWNQDLAENHQFFRFSKAPDGHGIVHFLPGQGANVFRQEGIILKQGKKYRLGAKIRTRGLDSRRSGVIIYNYAWTKETGIEKLPADTGGWKDFEVEITAQDTRFSNYVFAIYTVDFKKGELAVRDPFLRPADDQAAEGTQPALSIAGLYRITPAAPRLSKINADKPEMSFSFRYQLPENDQWVCRVKTRMTGEKAYGKAREFPVTYPDIHTRLGKLTPGKGHLHVEIAGKTSGRILSQADYPITVVRPVVPVRPPRRLNMLVQRLLTVPGKDGIYRFTNPRDGWLFLHADNSPDIQLRFGQKQSAPLQLHSDGQSRETLRYLPKGNYQLHVTGASGGRLIVNSVPEILIYAYPLVCSYKALSIPYETYHPEFVKNYLFPNITTINFGYGLGLLPPGAYDHVISMGKRWFGLALHRYNLANFETPEAMAQRFRSSLSPKEFHGKAFDEIAIESRTDKWIYTQAMWKLLDMNKPFYTWSSGVKFSINGLNADYLSSVINNGNSQGKFLFECYSRTQPTEKEAEVYLEDYLNENIRRAEQLIPGSTASSMIINGGYTLAGSYCTNTFTEPDVKYFWDMYFWKLANEPEFKDLGGVGIYCYYSGHEEAIRWHLKLFRHYVLEGGKERLAPRYGYRYIPGFLKNGDFDQGMANWSPEPAAPDSLTIRHIDSFGRNIQKRQNRYQQAYNKQGNNLCRFVHSAKAPNRLSQTMTGFTPGKAYSLRFVSSDEQNLKKPVAMQNSLFVEFKGAKNITASSPVAKFTGSDRSISTYHSTKVNNHTVIFKPEQAEVTVTFTDWNQGKAPEKLSATLFNFIRVAPYFEE